MSVTEIKLKETERLIGQGLDARNMLKALEIIGINGYSEEEIKSFRLWGDYLPMGSECPYSEEERNMHILWECIDRTALGINCAFAIPFRTIIAKNLFKSCGDGFIANEGCRFNYGKLIEVGNFVTWNHCCYIDSKGGVKFGDYSMITEYSKIFTHGHSESNHMERTYNPVELCEYAKVYSASTILPGVKIGKGAVVATGAIVTKSVDDFTLVAGIPAKPVRARKTENGVTDNLNHFTFEGKAFQPYENYPDLFYTTK